MWTYEQWSGWLIASDGKRLAKGYAGAGNGKNSPVHEDVRDVGPIPRGKYDIEAPIDTVTHGPCVLRLIPNSSNEMFGRSGFLMHGDSVVEPGTASLGCIVQPRFARERVANSGDHELIVI